MGYSIELRNKAKRVLQKRHDDAETMRDIAVDNIKEAVPEIDEIQRELSRVGLEISSLFFAGNNFEERFNELRQVSLELQEKRKQILVKNGYPEDAMQPKYTCMACSDKGYIDGKMCDCHRRLLKQLMRNEIEKLAPLQKCTFESFSLEYYSDKPSENGIVPRQRAEKVFDACRRYAQNFSLSSKNLLFLGGAGLGKTHLSLAALNAAINKGYYVCYGTSQNICDDLQSEQFGRTDSLTYTKEQVLSCDLLVLDDLGTEIDNQYSQATIYNIINTRILSGRPTIISTNYTPSALDEKYGNRITSRLTGEYVNMYLFGNDIRNMK